MAMDYYAEAREVARCLQQDGFTAEASTLEEAIDSGSTGTEILMALRWHLQRIDQSNISASLQTRQRIRALVIAVDNALGA